MRKSKENKTMKLHITIIQLQLLASCRSCHSFIFNKDIFILLYYFLRFYLFLERGGGKVKGRETSMWERNIYQLPLVLALTGDWTPNPGVWPDRESNWWPYTSRDSGQPTAPHWSGLNCHCCFICPLHIFLLQYFKIHSTHHYHLPVSISYVSWIIKDFKK